MPAGKVKVDVKYKATKFEFTKGQNSTYKAEDNTRIEFRINGALSIFSKAYINGVELDRANYTLAEGSTILTLTDEYLETLSVGTYTIKAEYTNGTDAETTFTIASVPEKIEDQVKEETKVEDTLKNPTTGDNIIFITMLFIIALAGTTITFKARKNNSKKTNKK